MDNQTIETAKPGHSPLPGPTDTIAAPNHAMTLINVGQVWRSPFLNVFDRTIKQIQTDKLYFTSPGSAFGWISLGDWLSWVRATRATAVSGTET